MTQSKLLLLAIVLVATSIKYTNWIVGGGDPDDVMTLLAEVPEA